MESSWEEMLQQLHNLAITVPNRHPASEDILGLHHVNLKHTDDHWEELNPSMHTLFGWNTSGGLLTARSSQSEFLLVHKFLHRFFASETSVEYGSCLGSMRPRVETAISLCRTANNLPSIDTSKTSNTNSACDISRPPDLVDDPDIVEVPEPSVSLASGPFTRTINYGGNKRKHTRTASSDESENSDTERTHQKRVKAARNKRETQLNENARIQLLEELKKKNEILDFGESFVKCCCGSLVTLDTTTRRKTQATKSGKERKPPPPRRYDLNKWKDHRQRCPAVTGTYKGKKYVKTKPISAFFGQSQSQRKPPLAVSMSLASEPSDLPAPSIRCQGRRDKNYAVLAKRAVTGDYGGVGSVRSMSDLAKELFPYKWKRTCSLPSPSDSNRDTNILRFTSAESASLHDEMKSRRDWFVDGIEPANRTIRAANCLRRFTPDVYTQEQQDFCSACHALDRLESLQRCARRAAQAELNDQSMSAEDLVTAQKRRVNNTSLLLMNAQSKDLANFLKDERIMRTHRFFMTGETGQAFMDLYLEAQRGHLQGYELFEKISLSLADTIARKHDNNPSAKYGKRYDQDVLNFHIAMRGYGAQSNVQYSLLSQVIGGVCERRLRTITSKATEKMDSPDLTLHNVSRLARQCQQLKHSGIPIVLAMDCTVLKGKLMHSVEFGSHILGGTLPLSEMEVKTQDDIDGIIKKVVDQKALASQVRLLIGKVPLPGCPPVPLAVLPTRGTETAEDNAALLMRCRKLCADVGLSVLSAGADGASAEVGAHDLVNTSKEAVDFVRFTLEKYGVTLTAPIFDKTGPLVTITDPAHVQKVLRDNEQSGTHLLSIGESHLVHNTLVSLRNEPNSGLVKRDVENTEKQDDGAAIRIYHSNALKACATATANGTRVDPRYCAAFIVHFIFGDMFDAVFKRDYDF